MCAHGFAVVVCCLCLPQVVGACIFVGLVNRLLLPWYTSDYALEQLADALEQSAELFAKIYHSQLERMRLAELVAGKIKREGPEILLQVHVDHSAAATPAQQPSRQAAAPAAAPPAGLATPSSNKAAAGSAAEQAVQLAACEAAEAQLLVVLRQQVLSRLVGVQLSLAKESVSWRRGVLATPPLVLNVLGAMNAVKEALTSQRLALAPFTRHGAASLGGQAMQGPAGGGGGVAAAAAAAAGSGMLHTMVHCYSMWALPLHPLWLEVSVCMHVHVCVRERERIVVALSASCNRQGNALVRVSLPQPSHCSYLQRGGHEQRACVRACMQGAKPCIAAVAAVTAGSPHPRACCCVL